MTRGGRPRKGRIVLIVPAGWGLFAPPAHAGEADVVAARARCDAARVCSFEVSVRHADEGWNHYANAWQILSPDGEVLATRVLRHPHVDEQPFTRSLSGVKLPASLDRVRIRARDSRHGIGGREIELAVEGADPD